MGDGRLRDQTRALGNATRYRVYGYLVEAGRPVDVAELTGHFGLNHNAIRQALAKLVGAGLVRESTERRSLPGRPRRLYEPDPRARSTWRDDGPYQRLSALLVEILASGKSPEEVGRDAGRNIDVSKASGGDRLDGVVDSIARGGFDPRVRTRGDATELVLQHCPFADAAAIDPDTVCDIHLGLAQGLVEQVEGVDVLDLIRADPHLAGCRLRLRHDPGAEPG